MLSFLTYGGGLILFGIITGQMGTMTFGEMGELLLCLVGVSIPFGVLFVCYKILEKYREKNPAKESVQKLNLNDPD